MVQTVKWLLMEIGKKIGCFALNINVNSNNTTINKNVTIDGSHRSKENAEEESK